MFRPARLCVCIQVGGPVREARRGARHQPAGPGGRGVELTPPTVHQGSPLRLFTSPGESTARFADPDYIRNSDLDSCIKANKVDLHFINDFLIF
jgi:hypothetical protein